MAFPEAERNIFKYHNGIKDVFADPVKLQVKMYSTYPAESTFEHDFKLLKIDIKEDSSQEKLLQEYHEALIRIGKWACNVFNLKELDEDGLGLTINEALEVLARYMNWIAGLKKSTETTPISPVPTESVAT